MPARSDGSAQLTGSAPSYHQPGSGCRRKHVNGVSAGRALWRSWAVPAVPGSSALGRMFRREGGFNPSVRQLLARAGTQVGTGRGGISRNTGQAIPGASTPVCERSPSWTSASVSMSTISSRKKGFPSAVRTISPRSSRPGGRRSDGSRCAAEQAVAPFHDPARAGTGTEGGRLLPSSKSNTLSLRFWVRPRRPSYATWLVSVTGSPGCVSHATTYAHAERA